MSPTLFHQLKHHVKGWSSFYVNPIDVRKVISISWHPRLFCIFNQDYPYTLKIKYYDPRNVTIANPVFTSGGHTGIALTNIYEEHSYMEIRYKTENEVHQEINEINNLQNIIKNFDQEQNKNLINFANRYQINKKK
jgi:hypothetical protein